MTHPIDICGQLPFLTPELKGIGGQIKCHEEDFFVEEIPLYEPSGQGDHTFVSVEKRRRTTEDVANSLAR